MKSRQVCVQARNNRLAKIDSMVNASAVRSMNRLEVKRFVKELDNSDYFNKQIYLAQRRLNIMRNKY